MKGERGERWGGRIGEGAVSKDMCGLSGFCLGAGEDGEGG